MRRFKVLFIIKRIVIIILFFIMSIILLAYLHCFIERRFVNKDIKKFIDRSEYYDTIVIRNNNINLYRVTPSYDFELENYQDVLNCYNESYILGNIGDITITTRNPLKTINSGFIKDCVNLITKPFYSGHATVNINEKEIIESVGNDTLNGVRIKENFWFDMIINDSLIEEQYLGLRIKNLDTEKKDKFIEELNNQVGKKYNYNFLISNKNSFYCLDLISLMVKRIDIRLNYDLLLTTGNDLIISDNTFIIYVCERIDKENINLYYLQEV